MINFLYAVKLVLRVMFTKNDPDVLFDLADSERRLSEQDPKSAERLKKSASLHSQRSGNSQSMSLTAQIAASKIQRLFKARKARKAKYQRPEQSSDCIGSKDCTPESPAAPCP